MGEWLRPTADRDSAAWWDRVAKHEFAVQQCDTCGTRRFPARAFCHACRTESWHWEPIDPLGRVESWIVNRQAFAKGAAEPYVVVMVRLDAVPDCVVYGNWHGDGEPKHGELVQGSFSTVDEELSLVNWRPRD